MPMSRPAACRFAALFTLAVALFAAVPCVAGAQAMPCCEHAMGCEDASAIPCPELSAAPCCTAPSQVPAPVSQPPQGVGFGLAWMISPSEPRLASFVLPAAPSLPAPSVRALRTVILRL